jgi:pimeloyl-ACP methyl ester carboxylesterase
MRLGVRGRGQQPAGQGDELGQPRAGGPARRAGRACPAGRGQLRQRAVEQRAGLAAVPGAGRGRRQVRQAQVRHVMVQRPAVRPEQQPELVRARVLHAAQQPLAGSSFTDVMGTPSWKSRPSWSMVATGDQAIPPDAERLFASRMGATTVEVDAGHLAMVSHPGETAQLITAAAEALG